MFYQLLSLQILLSLVHVKKIAVQTNIKMLVIHLRNCIKFYNVRRKWYMRKKKSLIAGNKNFELEV